MFSVEEVAEQLKVSKVTVYSKLKKFDDKVVIKQGKKYITDELFILIKQDLKIKEIDNDNLNRHENINGLNEEIATDTDELINLNKELIKTLIDQLDVKDKQLEEKDRQITELHKLIENSQVLLKQEKDCNQLQLEEHIKELDSKITNVKEKMDQKRESRKKGFFDRFLK